MRAPQAEGTSERGRFLESPSFLPAEGPGQVKRLLSWAFASYPHKSPPASAYVTHTHTSVSNSAPPQAQSAWPTAQGLGADPRWSTMKGLPFLVPESQVV